MERCPTCSGLRAIPRMIFDDEDVAHECKDAFHNEPTPKVVEMPPVATEPDAAEEPSPEQEGEEQSAAANQPAAPIPICPHCHEKMTLKARQIRFGTIVVLVVFCGNLDCLKIYNVFQPLQLEVLAPPAGMPLPPLPGADR